LTIFVIDIVTVTSITLAELHVNKVYQRWYLTV